MAFERVIWRCLTGTTVLLFGAALRVADVRAQEQDGPASALPEVNLMEIRAQLIPLRYTTLAAEMDGRISRLAAREGDGFAGGQVLVQFDCSTQRAQLHQAEVEVAAARKSREAKEKLFELNAVGELELELARSEVERAMAERATTTTQLGKCRIAAPYAGRVAAQRVQAEQFVRAGEPLLEILDDRNLELQFIVPSRWLRWLKVGGEVGVVIDETGKQYRAKISRIAPRIDAVSQTVKIVAIVVGEHGELLAGMSGQVIVPETVSGQ